MDHKTRRMACKIPRIFISYACSLTPNQSSRQYNFSLQAHLLRKKRFFPKNNRFSPTPPQPPYFYLDADFGATVYAIPHMDSPSFGSFLLLNAHEGIRSIPHWSSLVSQYQEVPIFQL